MKPPELVPRERDVGRLRALYTRLELRSLLRQLPGADAVAMGGGRADVGTAGAATTTVAAAGFSAATADAAPLPPAVERHYETILDAARLDAWLQRPASVPTPSLSPSRRRRIDHMQAEIVGVSIAVEPGRVAYVPLAHDYPGAPAQLERAQVLARLRPLLEDDARSKIGHHLKIAAHVLRNNGIELRGMRFDSMLESYVLNSTATRHDLEATASVVPRRRGDRLRQRGRPWRETDWRSTTCRVEQGATYAAEHADSRCSCIARSGPGSPRFRRCEQLYDDIEQPLAPVLLDMEHAGVLIDADMLRRQSGELAQGMLDLAERSASRGGRELQPRFAEAAAGRAVRQARAAGAAAHTRRVSRRRPRTCSRSSRPSTSCRASSWITARSRSSSRPTPTSCRTQVNPRTGRVHTCYHQAVAATGRLSSTEPNLQNIPIRTPEGRRIRQAFVAPPGFVMIAADYSQIELRIMAHLSGRRRPAARVRGRSRHPPGDGCRGVRLPIRLRSAPDQRRAAKAINFGLIYGMSAFGLARQLGIERGAAQKYVDLYFQRYPGREALHGRARAPRRASAATSRRCSGAACTCPTSASRNAQLRQYAERSAINAPMQGTAADIIKRAMIAVHRLARAAQSNGARLVMQVHDELVLEVPSRGRRTPSSQACARA